MNTTFTTCAEKKAKQFLNLLQGYTKGIRLTAILILLLMGVNNVWGDNNVKVYCAIKASDLNCYTLKVNANIGDNNTWRQYTMEKLDETYEGRLIYQATIVERYGGVDALQFQLYEGNDWKTQQQPYNTWTTSSTFANKLYVYDTDKWITKTNDPSYTVYFVNKDSWTGTIKAYAWNSDCDKNKDWSGADMTSTGKTYKGKNIYSITLNKRYANIIFNNGSSKTDDLTLGSTNIGKMFDGSSWVDYNVDPVVTFKANGGTGSDYTQTVKYNTSTALTANKFTRTGYSFNGWKTAANSGTSYANQASVKFTANTTLYAQWTANQYTITYKDQGGSNFSGSHASGYPTKHTYGTATTLSTATKTGYTFDGWFTTQDCTGSAITSLGATAYTAAITLYAKWTANKYTVTLDNQSATTAGTASVQATYGSAMPSATMPQKTGYTFGGYYTAINGGGTKYYNANGSSAKNWDKTAAAILYAQWTAKDITINWDANGGSVTPTSSTYTYDGDAITLPTPSYAGHRFLGWFTAADGGTQITDVGTTNKPYTTVTYYAHWEVSIVEHTVTFAVGTESTEYGTLTAATNSGNITSGSNVIEGTSVTFTAKPNTGYVVEGWYTNATCTEGKHDAGSATYTTTVNDALNVYVKFVEKKWSVAFAASTGGTVTTPSSTPQTVGEVTGISIAATPATGYTFKQWTITSGAGSFTSEATTNSNTFKPTNNSTVTASFNETMSTLTTSNKYDVGNPEYAIPTKSVNSIGVATTATVTATAAGNGYTFTGWTLTNCTRTDGGADDATSITVRSNGDGKAATVVANYAEDLTTSWVLKGSFVDDFATAYKFVKKSGESTGKVAYVSLDLADSKAYRFKVVNGSTWYGNNNSDEQYWIKATAENWDFYSDAGDCHMKSSVAGTYTFKIDFSGTNPKVSVQFPTAYKITYGVGTNKGTDKVTTTPSITSGSLVLASTSITFSKGDTKTGYTWKNWNNKNDGTGTVLGTGDTYVSSNREADITVYACYDLVTYNITYNTNGGTNPNNAQTSYNVTTATFNLPTPTKTGYTFAGWYDNAGLTGNKITQIAKGSTGHQEFWAKWTPNTYNITYKDQGGSDFSGTHADGHPTTHTYGIETTLKTASKTGYTFDGWHTDAACTQNVTSLNATAYTAAITLYAKWKALSFELTWDPNGGTITTPGSPEGGEVEAGTPLKAPTVTKEHYDNTGWNPEVPAVMPGEDVTYIAQWTPKEYKITYNLNGGNGTMTPATYTIESETFTLPNNPTKTGYTFAGWYANAELTGNAVTQIEKGSTGDKTYWAKWDVASYTITFDLEGGTGGTSTLTVQYEAQLPNITIPTKAGHLFLGYYNGDNGTGTQYYDASGKGLKPMPANNLTLYAKWLNSSDCIFFYNNLGWSNVYVYFYNNADGHNYWADGYGTGANKQQKFWENNPYYEMEHGTMTQIKGTNIWYYYATYIKTNQRSKVSFANVNQSCDKEANNTNSYFQNAQVVYRADLDYEKRVPMFVPHTTQSHYFSNTKSTYYNHGYWMNYPTNTGYKLHIFDENGNKINDQLVEIPFEYGDNIIMPWSVNVSLEGATTYAFKIQRADNQWYGNNGTMTTNSSGDVGQTAWEFTTGTNNCKITTTAPGTYVFTLKYDKDRNSNYNYLVGVEYPASVGDYRLAYKDNTHPFHPGHLLKKRAGSDIVSFFVHYDENPLIMLQHVTAIDAKTGAITWETLSTSTLKSMTGIEATGIYNFVLEQTDSEAILQNSATKYTGNFYIRTDATAGGWGNFRQKSNQMTYSSYADNHSNFNHYFVEWIHQGKNVKFTIANDYSYCLSDTLDADDIVTTGNLPKDANVRFGWDSHTNKLSRAYIAGTENEQYRFLVLGGIDDNLKDKDGNTLTNNEIVFTDLEDWIYQADVTANENTMIRLTAQYNNQTQYFKGAADGENQYIPVLTGGASGDYKIRFIYNFKSNHLVTAWLADGNNITENKVLGTDLMIIRQNQDAAAQLKLNSNETKLSEVGTIYATMTFTKEHLESTTASEWERLYYWISFPFDVRISDVFGFGEYGKQWIIEYYDGAARAKNGYWLESDTYWKYISDTTYVAGKSNEDANGNPNNGVLVANKGYVLALARSIANQGLFKNGNDYVRLYFPSMNEIGSIDGDMQNVVTLLQEYPCTITGREAYDNNWHMIGVPSYADKNHKLTQNELIYYYEYQASSNTYKVTTAQLRDPDISSSNAKSVTFKSMHSYMVQYAGTINWRNWATTPQQLAARRNTHSEQDTYSLRLELQRNGTYADQTFVQLKDESTTDYDMNIDLTKLMNSGTNIYTLAGEQRIQLAGSVIPVAETTIPVGVKVAAAGEYTLAMPDGTDGITALLIDYETNTTTDLLLSDYTVTLPKGSTENRFALIVKPRKTATRVENIGEGAKDADKYIIDGALYLQRDGKLYNAQGQIMR
ncbi:MAG: InlB B-repeat-containing protein [Paludibacteraceae bacterium]|nr:InlB B-repeat-containing protein [Paludibacteraceae bacterium]